jgi:cell division protein ZapA
VSELEPVKIRILDKEYQIACLPDERESLLAAADYLNGRMRELRGRGNVIGSDRLAVITALNLSHEMLHLRQIEADYKALSAQMAALQEQVGRALAGEQPGTPS